MLLATGCSTTATQREPHAEVDALKTASVGDTVTFGTYEQDNNLENGPEPIEWTVINTEEGQSLLLCNVNIDCKPFNNDFVPTDWEQSTLRAWLNTTFIETAFDEHARLYIPETELVNEDFDNGKYFSDGGKNTKDQIFLLSTQDLTTYNLSLDLMLAKNTPFAVAQGCYDNFGYGWWWTRSIGSSNSHVGVVNHGGHLSVVGTNVNYAAFGIRPALWVDTTP